MFASDDEQWEEVKKYFDPNPQLRGVDHGQYAVKVSLETSEILRV